MQNFNTNCVALEVSTVHTEEGVSMYSDVSEVASGFCSVCFQDAPEVRQISMTEFKQSDAPTAYRTTSLCICVGCIARILVAPSRATLSQGIVNDVA